MAKKAITKPSELTPDANNYNKGTEFGGGLIEKSLRKLGAGRSILLDKNGKVIAGNKTLENAVNAGFGDDDLIVVQTTGKQIVAVQRMDLDLDSKMGKEMALADNATAKANIEWDTDALASDWNSDEISDWGVGVASDWAQGDNSINSEAVEDDFDVPDIKTVQTDIVLGDKFEIGDHILLCGDSTNSHDVERIMGLEKADMVLTDPPYGVSYVGKTKDAMTIENDSLTDEQTLDLWGGGIVFNMAFAEGWRSNICNRPGGTVAIGIHASNGRIWRTKAGYGLEQKQHGYGAYRLPLQA